MSMSYVERHIRYNNPASLDIPKWYITKIEKEPKVCRFARKVGSWPQFVKRSGLEVLQCFPAHGWEGEAAPLLRRNLLILLVQVAILMASRTLAKSPPI